MLKSAFGFDIYSCASRGSCWVWGIPPEGPVDTLRLCQSLLAQRSPEEPHPVENSDLLRTQQTGTSSPSPIPPTPKDKLNLRAYPERVPRLEISLKVFPERPPRSILTWLRGLKRHLERKDAGWVLQAGNLLSLMPTHGGILSVSAPRGPRGGNRCWYSL